MYCIHCGIELKDDARFCNMCGAPTVSTSISSTSSKESRFAGASRAAVFNALQDSVAVKGSNGGFTAQMESDRQRSRKRLTALMIVALVFAALISSTLATMSVKDQGVDDYDSGLPSLSQNVTAQSNGEINANGGIDGWWFANYMQEGSLADYALYHYNNDVVTVFPADKNLTPISDAAPKSYAITKFQRVTVDSEEEMSDKAVHKGETGYRFVVNGDNYWLLDNNRDLLICEKGDITQNRVEDASKIEEIEKNANLYNAPEE